MEFQPDVLLNLLQVDLGLKQALPLTSDISISDARKSALLTSVFKKLEPDDSTLLEAVAIAEFLRCNDKCLTATIGDDGYVDDVLKNTSSRLSLLYHSGECQSALFSLHDFCAMGAAGPGASLGTKRTDFLGKMFESELTTTDAGILKYYRSQLSPRWADAEKWRTRVCGDVDVRRGSSLSTVPKNEKTNRTICTEPTLNMYFQLGAGACLERLLKKGHNIDLSLQPDRNKAMARQGSVDGKFATIDLRSASDTISTTLVKRLLPNDLYVLLDLVRSKETQINGEWIRLHMFSSMGNGFTFPLQTLIFAELVRQAYVVLGIKPDTTDANRNYSVFGDDIICLKEAYDFVCQVLSGSGFVVNDDKSFNAGAFRESCGGDYFRGFDIRAVFLRERHDTQNIYSAFNRLARWSARYGIHLDGVLRYLKGLVDFQPVPLDEQDTAGFKIPRAYLLARKSDKNGAYYYTAYVAESRRVTIGSGFGSNTSGAILCSIRGDFRNNKMGIRVLTPDWKVKRRKTPLWDWNPLPEFTTRDLEYALDALFCV